MMPNPSEEDLIRWEKLCRAATAGPWCIEDPMAPESLWVVQAGKETYEWWPIAVCTMPDEEDHLFTGSEVNANAAFIAAAREALPVLIQALRGYQEGHGSSVAESTAAVACDRSASETPGESEGIYVASRASVLARGAMWRRHRAAGVPIISTWIDEDGENDTASLDELWTRIRREVVGARQLVLYVEPDDFPLKGAFVEIGMALAANVPITIVAPGVEIGGRNCRPFGSWIRHPSVSFAETVECAFQQRTPSPLRSDASGGVEPSEHWRGVVAGDHEKGADQ